VFLRAGQGRWDGGSSCPDAALEAIESDWPRHSRAARELAREHLDTSVVLCRFLAELGIP